MARSTDDLVAAARRPRENPVKGGSTMTDKAIAAQGLVKTYPKGVRALDGVGFEVAAGSVFGLVGPNGAGKSTTVKILTTLSRPDEGQATVAGIDVLKRPDLVRHAIGCVTQKSGVDVHATGRENMLLQGRLYGMSGRDARGARRHDARGLRPGRRCAPRHRAPTRAACSASSTSPWGWSIAPRCSFSTSRRPASTPRRGPTCGPRSSGSPNEEGLTILLTTHYLEEADRLARRLAIVDQGKVVAHRHARRAEERAARRRRAHRARRARDQRPRHRGAGADRRRARRRDREAACCTPAPTTAPAPCRSCCRPSRPTA